MRKLLFCLLIALIAISTALMMAMDFEVRYGERPFTDIYEATNEGVPDTSNSGEIALRPPEEIEHISLIFIDESRDNREIPTEIFLPLNGENLDLEGDGLPSIVFGHGWITPYTTYQTFWETIVPTGWIMAFPTTEGALFPSHEDFALDLAFLSFALPDAGADPDSPLFNRVDSLSVVMGHSMGGGCSILAASYDNNFSSVITLAAAGSTDPSAIAAAEDVIIPSLTFAGTSDIITPPGSHQLPLYENLASTYKGYISLIDVTHSGIYTNDTVFALLVPWLNYFLTDNPDYIDDFETLLELYENDDVLTYMIEGEFTHIDEIFVDTPQTVRIANYPNPFNPVTTFRFNIPVSSSVRLTIYNSKGQKVAQLADDYYEAGEHLIQWHAEGKSSGVYFYSLETDRVRKLGRCLLIK